MNKAKTYLVCSILFVTVCIIIFLIYRANQLEQYVLAPGKNINHLQGPENFLHIIQRLISNILSTITKQST
jgi:hypothetical protein